MTEDQVNSSATQTSGNVNIKIIEGINTNNIEIIQNYTNQTDYIFSARSTNPKAAIQLAQGAYAKGIEVKGKSSNENSLITVNPKLSKLGSQWFTADGAKRQEIYTNICNFDKINQATIDRYNKFIGIKKLTEEDKETITFEECQKLFGSIE